MRLLRNPIVLAAVVLTTLLVGCAFDSTGPSSPPVVTTQPATQPAYTNNPLENLQNNVSDLFH